MNKIQEILKNSGNHFFVKKDFQERYFALAKVNMEDYFVYICSTSSSLSSTRYLLGTFDFWKNYHYSNFKTIFKSLENHEIGLINLIIFVGKYLHIDLRKGLEIPNVSTKKYVLDYIGEKTSFFYFDKKHDNILLKKFELNFETSFTDLRNRLLQEGGEKARIIKPKQIILPPFDFE